MSALQKVDQQAGTVAARAAEIVATARALEVRTPEEAERATEFLSQIAAAKKQSEKARRFLVDPMNAHVKAINATFKEKAAPLEEADGVVREKVLAYRKEQQLLAAAEEQRLAAERADQERAAEAERLRLADEAAAARHAVEEAEAKRLADIAAAADEHAKLVAQMDDDELSAFIDSEAGGDAALMEVAEREVSARIDASNRAAAAERAEEEARQREIAAKSAPAVAVAPAAPLQSASGTAAEVKKWKGTVQDEQLVPRQYLIVDQRLINQAVRDGVREIPGVLIEQVDSLAVRAA